MCKFTKFLSSMLLVFLLSIVIIFLNNELNYENAVMAAVKDEIHAVTIDGEVACNHMYSWVITKKASCTSTGSMDWKCSKCSYINRTNTIAALGHNYSAATCTSPQICSRCKVSAGTPLGHSFSVATCTSPYKCIRCSVTYGTALGHDVIGATCTEPWKCSRCDVTGLKALGHDYSVATCTSAQKCTRCNETNGSALGHNYIYTKLDLTNHKITCSRCDYSSTTKHIFIDTKCKACGYIKIEEVAIDVCNHKYSWVTTKSATCTNTGSMDWKCSKCGYVERTNTIAVLDHNYSAATCTSAKKCTKCSTTTGSALGHNYIYTKLDLTNHKITCSRCEYSSTTKHIFIDTKCKACGYIKIEEVAIDVCNHKYSWVTTKSASCTSSGSMDWKCSKCGYIEKTNAISALGHNYSDATCTSAQVCNRCESVIGKALGHDYVYTNLDSTKHNINCLRCSTKLTGKHVLSDGKCKYCEYVEEKINVCNHSYNWIITKVATCTSDGVESNTCTICGEIEATRKIKALEHEYSIATCEKAATCGVCGETKGKKLEHTYSEATCEKPAICSVCNATKGKALEHKYEKIIIQEPTCTTTGTEENKCSRCGVVAESKILEATGHDYTEATCEKPATCRNCGATQGYLVEHELVGKKKDDSYHTVKCKECGYIANDELHRFVLGMCIGCKCKRICSDRSFIITHRVQAKKYLKLNEESHTTIYECKECKISIKKNESHIFDLVTGICVKCKFEDKTKAMCTSKGFLETHEVRILKYEQAEDVHTVTRYCEACDVLIESIEEHSFVEGMCKCGLANKATHVCINGVSKYQLTTDNGTASKKADTSKRKVDINMTEVKDIMENESNIQIDVFSAGSIVFEKVLDEYISANSAKENPSNLTIVLGEPACSYIGSGNKNDASGLVDIIEKIPPELRGNVSIEFWLGEEERSNNKAVYQTTINAYGSLYDSQNSSDENKFASVELYAIGQSEVVYKNAANGKDEKNGTTYECNNVNYDAKADDNKSNDNNPHEAVLDAIVENSENLDLQKNK